MSYLFNGLDEDSDSLIESVLSREITLSIHDIYARLLVIEQRTERRDTAEITTHSANMA